MTIYECLHDVINRGDYNVSDMEHKIDLMFIEGKLTEEQKEELYQLASDKAIDSQQIDYVAKLKELEDRIFALEHPTEEEPVYAVWASGYVTAHGETVQYDYNNDGVIDLLRYDGGRQSTSLRPGKIEGWHVVDSDGNILGTYLGSEFTPAP